MIIVLNPFCIFERIGYYIEPGKKIYRRNIMQDIHHRCITRDAYLRGDYLIVHHHKTTDGKALYFVNLSQLYIGGDTGYYIDKSYLNKLIKMSTDNDFVKITGKNEDFVVKSNCPNHKRETSFYLLNMSKFLSMSKIIKTSDGRAKFVEDKSGIIDGILFRKTELYLNYDIGNLLKHYTDMLFGKMTWLFINPFKNDAYNYGVYNLFYETIVDDRCTFFDTLYKKNTSTERISFYDFDVFDDNAFVYKDTILPKSHEYFSKFRKLCPEMAKLFNKFNYTYCTDSKKIKNWLSKMYSERMNSLGIKYLNYMYFTKQYDNVFDKTYFYYPYPTKDDIRDGSKIIDNISHLVFTLHINNLLPYDKDLFRENIDLDHFRLNDYSSHNGLVNFSLVFSFPCKFKNGILTGYDEQKEKCYNDFDMHCVDNVDPHFFGGFNESGVYKPSQKYICRETVANWRLI